MRRKICILVFLTASCLILCAAYSENVLSDINESGIVRLHIIANSNSAVDQKLKLSVRDELISQGALNGKINFEKIDEICTNQITKYGKNYGCHWQTGTYYFPTKSYKNIHLPAGNYNALRVVLGEGKGENWWCVMYPPLCFSESLTGEMAAEDETLLKEMMSDESFNLITSEEISLVPAFKIVEMWQEVKENTKSIVDSFKKNSKAT